MITKHVVCPIDVQGTKTALLSPGVGLARLLTQNQQPVIGGQAIFELLCLNTLSLVHLPADLSGIVVDAGKKSLYVGFHDRIAIIDTKKATQPGSPELRREPKPQGTAILSPMDGMFYLSPSPAEPPFVAIGQILAPGQMIGLIEVMKCFYPVKYQGIVPATITAVLIGNATAVSCGTRIFEVQ